MGPQTPAGEQIAPGGAATLDADAAIAAAKAPRLPHSDGSFGEIEAPSAFIHLTAGWAEWLLELRRVLADGGRLAIGLASPERFDGLIARSWGESAVGMTVLFDLEGAGRPVVFHSEWWLRAHWGRAFEIVSIREGERVVLTTVDGHLAPDDLRRGDPGDERELAAAKANVVYLSDQLERVTELHRRELDEQREEMSRELMRRSFAAADHEWARGGPGSPAALVAAEYEATTSWRMTKPLRTLGRLLRRDR
jgi:SAM-dependent methyltransferase